MHSRVLLVVALLGGCQGQTDRRELDRFESSVVQRLPASERRGDQLRMLEGRLAVAFAIHHDLGDVSSLFHVHGLATPVGDPMGFEVCIFGVDPEEAAKVLVEHALPPIVSRLEGRAVLGAQRFGPDSTFGVPGRSGFVGPVFSRGTADPGTLTRAGIFSDPPPIPGDDRPHLIKAIFYANDGRWLRAIELDGAKVLEKERLVPATTHGEGALVQFAVMDPSAGARRSPESSPASSGESRGP